MRVYCLIARDSHPGDIAENYKAREYLATSRSSCRPVQDRESAEFVTATENKALTHTCDVRRNCGDPKVSSTPRRFLSSRESCITKPRRIRRSPADTQGGHFDLEGLQSAVCSLQSY